LIERATIFQLFWSENSAKSEFCREEWRYALQTPRGRETNGVGFIRPVYWRKPMPTPPEELKHLHFAYVRLPRLNE
ncbi:MAG: toll/interleukin-1 receptor domain-containing protein, partial [Anaerolineae bacterium]|nr:toll/interleukin-1 receptor domain-containing protein [Anaerolineae bacterium]